MKRVIVTGCPGAGKSTFARALSRITGLPLYYLDMIWHRPDGTNIPREEFDARLSYILRGDSWIIDGNYQRTLEARLERCDTVFLLDYPLEVCLSGAAARIGRKREDMPWVEREFDPEFKRWIEDFGSNQLPRIYRLLQSYGTGRQVVVFHSRSEADSWLKQLRGRMEG